MFSMLRKERHSITTAIFDAEQFLEFAAGCVVFTFPSIPVVRMRQRGPLDPSRLALRWEVGDQITKDLL
jgi:hypothetical protein